MGNNAELRYAAALELYSKTNMSVKEICDRTDTPVSAFRAYLRRQHRDLMFARYGVEVPKEEAVSARLRKPRGQTPAAHAKYREAILACDDAAYIEYNVSQIAYKFHLSPTGLGNQLRNHFPEILERREKERQRLGIGDNLHRGVREWSRDQYAAAVEHLRCTDDTVPQTASLFNISLSGLRQHLLFYHKELVDKRSEKRTEAKGRKRRGEMTGNGRMYNPTDEQTEQYSEAIDLYRNTSMTQEEIASATGISIAGLRNYLRKWRRDLMLERRGLGSDGDEGTKLSETKRYLKSTAAKYADAIDRLKSSGLPTSEVAREFNLNPDIFREYLHEHEPELAASLGRKKLRNGKTILVRSAEKYEEAIHLYETTTESLRSIAGRLGIQYNSLNGFVRRSRPDAIESHNRIIEEEDRHRQEREKKESEDRIRRQEEDEKKRILEALRRSGNNRRVAAEMLGISKSTLYNRLNALDIRP